MKQREIKFRAWDESAKKMMYDNATAMHDVDLWDGVRASTVSLINQRLSMDFIWLQFTGLKDKNGVDIYEGDVLERTGHLYEVVFHEGGFCAKKLKGEIEVEYELFGMHRGYFLAFYQRKTEVIGNRYENPELMGGIR